MTETPASNDGKRARGRPKSIDQIAALDAAVRCFWRLGFDGASLGDLTTEMGVSRPSLYAAYGDKAALFAAALDRYGGTIGAAPMAAFEAEPDIGKAVRAFLRVSAESNTMPDAPAGCLIGCCAATAAEENPAIRDQLNTIFKTIGDRVEARFRQEVDAGHLSAIPEPDARAAILLDFMNAQAVRARAGTTRTALLAGVEARSRAVIVGGPLS